EQVRGLRVGWRTGGPRCPLSRRPSRVQRALPTDPRSNEADGLIGHNQWSGRLESSRRPDPFGTDRYRRWLSPRTRTSEEGNSDPGAHPRLEPPACRKVTGSPSRWNWRSLRSLKIV